MDDAGRAASHPNDLVRVCLVGEPTLTLSNPERGIGPIKRAARKSAHGQWQVQGVAIPVAGRWTVRLDVLVSDFEVVSLDEVIELAP
jgi:copper transport protein